MPSLKKMSVKTGDKVMKAVKMATTTKATKATKPSKMKAY